MCLIVAVVLIFATMKALPEDARKDCVTAIRDVFRSRPEPPEPSILHRRIDDLLEDGNFTEAARLARLLPEERRDDEIVRILRKALAPGKTDRETALAIAAEIGDAKVRTNAIDEILSAQNRDHEQGAENEK
jgi:hypothetical protein